jgi:hypothetical protein
MPEDDAGVARKSAANEAPLWLKVLIAGGLVGLTVFLVSQDALFAGVAVGFFALVCVYAVLADLSQRRIVREMQEQPGPPPAVTSPLTAAAAATAAAPLELSFISEPASLSADAQQLLDLLGARWRATLRSYAQEMWAYAVLTFVVVTAGDWGWASPLAGLAILITAAARFAIWRAMRRRAPEVAFLQSFLPMALYAGWKGAFMAASAYAVYEGIVVRSEQWRALAAAAIGWGLIAAWSFVATHLRWRKAVAQPPVDLIVLWVFTAEDAATSMISFVGPPWSTIGRVRLLRGGMLTVMPSDVMGFLMRRRRSDIAETPDDAERRIAEFDRAAVSRQGYYKQQYLLCSDASWEHAVDLLLARPSIVLMDLIGFSAEHRGCITEIRRLFSQVALTRCTFLVDPTTDLAFVEQTMREAWASRSASSPNAGPGVVRIMQLQTEMKREGRDLDASDANVARILKVLCMAAAESGLVARAALEGKPSP